MPLDADWFGFMDCLLKVRRPVEKRLGELVWIDYGGLPGAGSRDVAVQTKFARTDAALGAPFYVAVEK